MDDIRPLLPNVPVYLSAHQLPNPKTWIPYIEAWEPQYVEDRGNLCLVTLEDANRLYVGGTAQALFRRVATYHAIDQTAMRRHYAEATHKQQTFPLVIPSRKLALFAFKSRRTKLKHDGAVGYVANTRIQCVESRAPGQGVCIHLKSGVTIESPLSLNAFTNQRCKAGYFQYYLHVHQIVPL